MKDSKLVIGFIGLGACGSNIAETSVADGLSDTVYVINSSYDDLEALRIIDKDFKRKLKYIQGAAKDRNVALAGFKKEYADVIADYDEKVMQTPLGKETDVIFIAASAGGGTGSGTIPIVARILRKKYPEVRIVPVIVMPGKEEFGIVQANAIACINELIDAGFCMITVDNSKAVGASVLEKYDDVNGEICQNLKSLVKFGKVSRISNIDAADRLSMFDDAGLLVVGSAVVDTDAENVVKTAVKMAITQTPVIADLTKPVKKVAVQFEINPKYCTDKTRNDIRSVFRNAAGLFEGYYAPDEVKGESEETEEFSRILVAVSGAHLNASDMSEREALTEEFTEDTIKDEKSTANSALMSNWSTGPKGQPKDSKKDEGFDNLFDEVESLRG